MHTLNLFAESDYRHIIRSLVEEKKAQGEAVTLAKLATLAGMQKAHMTNVLQGRANFQTDQMFLVCKALKLSAERQTYMMLLLEQERCGIEERKHALAQEISAVQKRNMQTAAYLKPTAIATENLFESFPEYYLDPLHQILHIALSIERFSRDSAALAAALGIPMARLNPYLDRLENKGVITRKKGRYLILQRNPHLKRSSPLYKSWRQQLNALALSNHLLAGDEEHYGFCAVFSADEVTRRKMHGKILDLIRSFETDVASAPATGVYQVSIDLLPIL